MTACKATSPNFFSLRQCLTLFFVYEDTISRLIMFTIFAREEVGKYSSHVLVSVALLLKVKDVVPRSLTEYEVDVLHHAYLSFN